MNSASKYDIIFETAALSDLKHLPPGRLRRVMPRIMALTDDPRPRGVRKIVGSKSDWRIRVGDDRVIYSIDDDKRLVTVMRVKPRDRAYD